MLSIHSICPTSAANEASAHKQLLSIITPAFNEERNLPVLYEAIRNAMKELETSHDWEWIMRSLVGLEMPSTGADFFLLDRVVVDALTQQRESNVGIDTLLCSM